MTSSIGWSVLAGVAVFLALHVGIWRFSPANDPRVKLLGLLALVGTAVMVAVDLLLAAGNGLEVCAVLWTGLSLAVSYVIFYTILARSVSLTMLVHVLESGSQTMSAKDLVDAYEASSRFEDRLRLMHANGFVRISADSVALTEKGRWMGGWAKRLGRMLGSGLEG